MAPKAEENKKSIPAVKPDILRFKEINHPFPYLLHNGLLYRLNDFSTILIKLRLPREFLEIRKIQAAETYKT